MKILFVSKCSPFHVGGAEVRSWEVARELTRMGHQVIVLCAKMEANEAPRSEMDGIQIHCKKVLPDFLIKRFNYPHFFPLALSCIVLMFHLPFLLRREKFDLIREDISPFPPSGLLAFFRFKGLRRVAVIHNVSGTWKGWKKFYGSFYGFFGYWMDRFLRWGWLQYDQIICVALWMARDFEKFPKISDKLRHSTNGISREFFQHSARSRKFSPQVRLLSVGRLVEAKGHSILLEALSRLDGDSASFQLKILGEGPLKKNLLEQIARLQLTEKVDFLSWVSLKEMPAQYGAADLFVLPSLFEGGGPLSLLEAMAMKIPVVCAELESVKEFVGAESVLFFRKEDPQDLAEKIKWAMQNPEKMFEMADRAYEKVRSYSWEMVAGYEISEELGGQPVITSKASGF